MKLATLLLLLAAGPLEPGTVLPPAIPGAETSGLTTAVRAFHDGRRLVEARLLGPAELCPGPAGPVSCAATRRGQQPYRLSYPALPGVEVTAWIGGEAILLVGVGPCSVPGASPISSDSECAGADLQGLLGAAGAEVVRWLDRAAGLLLVRPDAARAAEGDDGIALAGRLQRQPWVVAVMPDLALPRRLAFRPDDPLFPSQWHLEEIGILAAWELSTGNAQVRIGVIDGGFEMTHPDLLPSSSILSTQPSATTIPRWRKRACRSTAPRSPAWPRRSRATAWAWPAPARPARSCPSA